MKSTARARNRTVSRQRRQTSTKKIDDSCFEDADASLEVSSSTFFEDDSKDDDFTPEEVKM